MNEIRVRVPGSCGEFIQGFYGNGESLVSYAIDCYSTITLRRSEKHSLHMNHRNEKAMTALKLACKHFNIDSSHLSVCISSDIPVGKGMASSTADIVAVLAAVSIMAGKTVDPDWIGKAAASIEPTDGIMYRDWTLFDHLHGDVLEQFGVIEGLEVLVLEMDEAVDTNALRATGAFDKSGRPNPSKALELFREAVKTNDMELLSSAMYLSAVENQCVLDKPFLRELHELSKQYGMIGVNAAHSGSVLGVVFRPGDCDPDSFLDEAKRLGYLGPYAIQRRHRIIHGGPTVVTE